MPHERPQRAPKFREISWFRAPPQISKRISRNSRLGLALFMSASTHEQRRSSLRMSSRRPAGRLTSADDGGGQRDRRLLPPEFAEQLAGQRPLGLKPSTISKILLSFFGRRVAQLSELTTRGRSGRSRRYDMTARSDS